MCFTSLLMQMTFRLWFASLDFLLCSIASFFPPCLYSGGGITVPIPGGAFAQSPPVPGASAGVGAYRCRGVEGRGMAWSHWGGGGLAGVGSSAAGPGSCALVQMFKGQ